MVRTRTDVDSRAARRLTTPRIARAAVMSGILPALLAVGAISPALAATPPSVVAHVAAVSPVAAGSLVAAVSPVEIPDPRSDSPTVRPRTIPAVPNDAVPYLAPAAILGALFVAGAIIAARRPVSASALGPVSVRSSPDGSA